MGRCEWKCLLAWWTWIRWTAQLSSFNIIWKISFFCFLFIHYHCRDYSLMFFTIPEHSFIYMHLSSPANHESIIRTPNRVTTKSKTSVRPSPSRLRRMALTLLARCKPYVLRVCQWDESKRNPKRGISSKINPSLVLEGPYALSGIFPSLVFDISVTSADVMQVIGMFLTLCKWYTCQMIRTQAIFSPRRAFPLYWCGFIQIEGTI